MTTEATNQSFSIINTGMTVEAMRDSGYKSTIHALAEIIDNAIEAKATNIQVFGVSGTDSATGRTSLRELAILDNGNGMDEVTLRRSLRYGDGTRTGRQGIGRFGVGLPNASLSQASRVDVWSWQAGVTNALHTHLAISDVQAGATEIPRCQLQPIPAMYLESADSPFEESGTLVVWSHLDRVEWKQASTTFKHAEFLLGRLYRRFLVGLDQRLHPKYADDAQAIGVQRKLTLMPIVMSSGQPNVQSEHIVRVRPNDPLYLMYGTSCPEDFGGGPMFQELDGSPFEIIVTYRGTTHIVRVRAAYARPHVRDSLHTDAAWPERWRGHDAGHTPWGKHAGGNLGVSMMRAHREIELDASWVIGYDPVERWWKVEVDFPTALDDVFGVTNNKQGTVTFQRMSRYEWQREALDGEESAGDVRRRMEDEGDHRVHLLDLRKQIENAIKIMRHRVSEARRKRDPRHTMNEDQKADAKATAAIRRRLQEGHKGESDVAEEQGTEEEHAETQVETLVNKHHFAQQDALDRVRETIEAGNRVRWIKSNQASPAFFDVDALPGVIQVALNTNHPVHSHLYNVMHPDIDDLSEEEVRERLRKAAAAFRILIYSWARYEDEQTDKARRTVMLARTEWGKYAMEFFEEGDDSTPPADLV